MSFGVGFLAGIMTFTFAYAMFSGSSEVELVHEVEDDESDVIANDHTVRYHTLYCENCRKKKRHRELVPRKFECTRCKRITDLRIPS